MSASSDKGKKSGASERSRGANTAAAASVGAPAIVVDDRAVRQRRIPAAAAASSAAAAGATFPRLSLMRLAVVERQLIMQGLDFTSLARLASSCRQMRREALHKDAGKFISSVPENRYPHPSPTSVVSAHPAHASSLFLRHGPMRFSFNFHSNLEMLIAKAVLFSRIVELYAIDTPLWTEERILQLLALPCMQHVESVDFRSSVWLESARVQTALCSLPRLRTINMKARPVTTLLPDALKLALKLATLKLAVYGQFLASARSLRALRSCRTLSSLDIAFESAGDKAGTLREIVLCLPPNLTNLRFWGASVPRDAPRPLIKALFSRTPMLHQLHIGVACIEPCVRGLLDAGVTALPSLQCVEFTTVAPEDFSFDVQPDPIPALLRRFLHRFPQTTLRLEFEDSYWQEELQAVYLRYAGWPRLELRSRHPGPMGGPMSPHASDDEEGSDVEAWDEHSVG